MRADNLDLAARIDALDDATALRLLQAVTQSHLRDESNRVEWSPVLAQSICSDLAVAPASTAPPSGDVARTTLLLLACEPDKAGPIAVMIQNPAPQRFVLGPVGGTLLVSAALFALKSHVQIERDKQGRWSFKFISKPATSGQIGLLIKKLVSLIGAGPPEVP